MWIFTAVSIDISTHSLTKRLTTLPLRICSNYFYFNSQPHEEADRSRTAEDSTVHYFNSQPHEEADFPVGFIRTPSYNFNSQPHEEADGNFRQKYIYLKLFFTLIAHINLVFYSNHYIVNFFLVKYTHFLVRMS